MTANPAVSILMPVYNAAPFLAESLGGLLRQTLENIEIICVNDGSTDGSLELMQAYAASDSRIRIVNNRNGGYGNAMNAGLQIASGDYIGILEPDDFADENMFEVLYQTAIAHRADLVKSNYWSYKTEDGSNSFTEPLWEKPYGIVTSSREDPRLVIGPPCIWTAIYDRQMLLRHHLSFTETPGASYQDTAFAFKALVCAERVVFLKEAFLHYRTDNSNSSVKSPGKIFSICDEFASIQDFLNADRDLRARYSRALQVHKLRVYGWNMARIPPEYRELFRTQVGLDFVRAEFDGFLHPEDFSEKEWASLQRHIEFVRNSPSKQALASVKSSASYRIGRGITYLPRRIRDLARNP